MPLGILMTMFKLPIDHLNVSFVGLVSQGFRAHCTSLPEVLQKTKNKISSALARAEALQNFRGG